MKTRDKQNKLKLKFNYIANLKLLGKIWKEHRAVVETDLKKTDKNYIDEVIRAMSVSKKEQFSQLLNVCDDILDNISNVDDSLKISHEKFKLIQELF